MIHCFGQTQGPSYPWRTRSTNSKAPFADVKPTVIYLAPRGQFLDDVPLMLTRILCKFMAVAKENEVMDLSNPWKTNAFYLDHLRPTW